MSRVLQPLVHVLQQHGIGRVTHVQARLVQQSHDAIVGQVNQLANDLKKGEFVQKYFLNYGWNGLAFWKIGPIELF